MGFHWTTSRLLSKVKAETRDMTLASGDVSYTGYGFKPTTLEINAVQTTVDIASIGFSDSARVEQCIVNRDSAADWWRVADRIVSLRVGATPDTQSAFVKSYDADGFTLTWSKTNLPTGTGSLKVRAMR